MVPSRTHGQPPIEVREDFPKAFNSTVKRITLQGSHIVWSIGDKRIIKETPRDSAHETPFDEREILEFIRSSTQIPVGLVVEEYTSRQTNGILVHVMWREMLEGDSIERMEPDWTSITTEQQLKIVDQTAALLQQLRGLTAPYMGRLNRTPLVDMMLFNVNNPTLQGPFDSDDALFSAMTATLDGKFPGRVLGNLRKKMPECRPYTFTHGDLSQGNIIVHKGEVTGIIDFKWSGYFPVWWEYVKNRAGNQWNPNDWVNLLSERIDPYPDAWEFWWRFHALVRLTRGVCIDEGYRVLAELYGEVGEEGILLR